MDNNYVASLTLVLKSEGGWSDNPADNGGATMKGVTLTNFRRYVKADATKADLRKITDAQLGVVYRRFYWDPVLGSQLPAGVDYCVFDYAVNSGPARAAKALQAVVGAVQDGRVGPATLVAVAKVDAHRVIDATCDQRMAFLKRLDDWKTFGKGWTSRVAAVRKAAHAMVDAVQKPVLVQLPVTPTAPVPEKPIVVTTEPGKETTVSTTQDTPPAAQPTVPQKHTGWLSLLALALSAIVGYIKVHLGG